MQARSMRQLRSAALTGAGLVLVLVLGAGLSAVGRGQVLAAQQQRQTPPQLPQLPSAAPNTSNDFPPSVRAHLEAQRVRLLNDDRHKRMVEDANKLIMLANELKAEVDKTGKDQLSMDVIRKAAEIEKLAHDVQNRMKN